MRRSRFSKFYKMPSKKTLVTLCIASLPVFLSYSSVAAADASDTATIGGKPIIENIANGNIIQSIGFRECRQSAQTSFETTTSPEPDAIKLSNLSIKYFEKSNKILLQAEGTTYQVYEAASAHIKLTAFDRVFYDQKINLNEVESFIPQFKGRFSFQETFSAPSSLPNQLPKQLFSLPAIEALASIQLYNSQGNPILCTSVPLTNAISANSPAIAIASASITVAAAVLSLISGILASISSAAAVTSLSLVSTGNGVGANPINSISPSLLDVVSFCQFISMSGSLNVEYPEILRQWTQNFGWSMGLIYSEKWNKAIDNLRSKTMKTNSTNLQVVQLSSNTTSFAVDPNHSIQSVNGTLDDVNSLRRNTEGSVMTLSVQKIADNIAGAKRNINKRQDTSPAGKSTVQVGADLLPSLQDNSLMNRVNGFSDVQPFEPPRQQETFPPAWPPGVTPSHSGQLGGSGFVSLGERLEIPSNNMFMTSFFLFLILLLVTSVFALIIRVALEFIARFYPGKFVKIRRRFVSYYIGNLLRVVLLSYFAVATLAFYQVTIRDSWVITLLAVMTLLLFIAVATYITLRLRRAGGTSLYFDERLMSKYGVLYDQYASSAYWFFVPVLAYQTAKAAIIGLGNGGKSPNQEFHEHNGSSASWAQMILLLLVEVYFAAVVIWKRPFSRRTPNRLNSVLGCVRVLNVIMLAVLIESATISDISKAAVGLAIVITQAVMMAVLAILILYQLGNALWRLRLTINNKDQEKEIKDVLEGDEVIVVSIKDHDKYDKDGKDEDQFFGRSASEIPRSSNESMTSLVGMMGIGSNPTIRYTPASDDEEEELGKDMLMERYHVKPQQTQVLKQTEETKADTITSFRDSNRDSSQSAESDSSLILDYYNPSYLPSSNRSKAPKKNDEPWVQAAYMTRRRSESSVHGGRQNAGNGRSKGQSKGSAQRRLAQEEEEEYEELQQMLQQRRRPKSLSTARYDQERMGSGVPESEPRLPNRSSRIPDFATFQSTYIPESLLDGPPPPTTMPPRRMSTITTVPLSSITVNPPPLYSETSLAGGPAVAATSMTASILNFEEYRFPDERATRSSDDPQSAARRAAITAAQRNIHPLSPFHPDFQHPDDLYNAALPSPNEEGPKTTSLSCRSSLPRINVVNIPQDGKNSRREPRSASEQVITKPKLTSSPSLRKAAAGLRIITNPKKIAQPPQIPVPALPNSACMTAETVSTTFGSMLSSSPTSSMQSLNSSNNAQKSPASPDSMSSSTQGRTRSSSNAIECQLVSSSPSNSPPLRQRALTATPTTVLNTPLTVSNIYRNTRATI